MLRRIMVALAGVAGTAASAAAQTAERPAGWQIASAVLPLPDSSRAGAAVLGYANGKLVRLRAGTNDMICLADNPEQKGFEASCYHKSLEPFMARGRALRATGVKGEQVDSVRFREIRQGRLAMPKQPAALYSLTGTAGSYDPATNTAAGAHPLSVIYISGATTASTGLSATPKEDAPWIMFPGTPKAHIMLVPKM